MIWLNKYDKNFGFDSELDFSFLKNKNGPNPASFCLFSFFSNKIVQKNCRIRTRIVGVEGERADHLTTTTAQIRFFFERESERIVDMTPMSLIQSNRRGLNFNQKGRLLRQEHERMVFILVKLLFVFLPMTRANVVNKFRVV